MKMLKKGFIALTVLGVVLYSVTPFLSPGKTPQLLVFVFLLWVLAIPFGSVGTVSVISYEKWVEYRNHPVKSAVWLGPVLPLLQIGFAALTVVGVVLFFVGPFRPQTATGNIYTLLGLPLFLGGVVGSFVVWLVSWVAHRKRAGKESSLISPRSVLPEMNWNRIPWLIGIVFLVFQLWDPLSSWVSGIRCPGGPDGPYQTYHENGQVDNTGTLKDGCWHGPADIYHENGQLRIRSTYKDGFRDGPSEGYYENGQLRQKITYTAGELDGPYETYYENGQLQQKGVWNMGESCGEWIEDGETVTYDPCPTSGN